MNARWRTSFIAASLLALATAMPAPGAGPSDPQECAPEPLPVGKPTSERTSLHALRPTLLKVAEDYDKRASEYEGQAERFRTWASAEDMFGGTTYGKRYAAIYFADEASALEKEASESRRLAAKYRQLANSRQAASGC